MQCLGTQEEAAEAYDIAAIKFRGLNAVTNFDMSRYDVKSILESSTLPIGGAAKRLKEVEQAEVTVDGQRTDDDNMSSQLTDAISNYGAAVAHHGGWPTLAFQQAHHHQTPFTMHNYPYGQRLWCKQEQDSDNHSGFHDNNLHHQLQLSNTHNFFQPNSSVLHNLMGMDSSSMEHSSGSNSVMYSNGGSGDHQGHGYGNGTGGYVVPMATVIANDVVGNQSQNGFGDHENVFGSSSTSTADPYSHARSLYYLSQQSQVGVVKASSTAYDQGSACSNNWVPTAVPTLGPRSNINVAAAVCHGTPTFTVWNDT